MEMPYRCLYTEENKEHVQFREHDWLVDCVHLTKHFQVHYQTTWMALHCSVSTTAAGK